MHEDLSVVLASNRGPFSFTRTETGLTTKGAAGGASPALDAVAKRLGDKAFWVATAITDEDREAVESGRAQDLADELGYGFRFLTFDPQIYSEYYNEVSNRMLWYANHCLWDEVGLSADDLDKDAFGRSYEFVNKAFAHEVADHVSQGALVLFQDYHLATAPRHLRELRPGAVISHFTHSSFCGPSGMAVVPADVRHGVIEGMLGADLVGFHVAPWVEGFLRCCETLGARVDRKLGAVDHDGRRTWVRGYPIPIDSTDLVQRAHADKADEWATRFREWRGDTTLIVRGDRAEPSKNIVRGFEAFGLLLDQRPDLRGRVRFAACLYPSRQDLDEYVDYARRIEEVVERVNARHEESIKLYMQDDFDRTLGAYRVYDVLLVNPIMDGMNLVSKEGPALNEHDGVLVLSEGAGSFSELGGSAVGISDPFDLQEAADALARAIDMPQEERAARASALRALSQATKPGQWIQDQLDDLELIADGSPPATPASNLD